MEHTKLKPYHLGQPNSGVALVLVLMLVVLTTILMLAFFLSVQTESKSMRSVISGQSSRQLADIAVQSVIAQIQQATTQGTKVAWVSQPGMIRCYDNVAGDPPVGWYKLYSASTNVVTPPSESASTFQTYVGNDVPTQAWATPGSPNYGVYTDINSPVYSSDGSTNYPVANPNGATSIATANGTTTSAVLGFDIATGSTPGYTSGGKPGSNASPINNPAAMPVLWLYVLQNGAIATPNTGGNGTVTFNSSGPVPTAANPIVGRVAYWTDDETCKVNVNTAGDGTYFDTPRFAGPAANGSLQTVTPTSTQDADIVIEHQLSTTPPVAGEYQRNVGGPAQTKLSYVLGSTIVNSGNVNKSNLLTLLSPFMQWGGSEGGTYNTYSSLSAANALTAPTRQTPYASLDEWMFSNQQLSSNTRVPNPGTVAASPPALLTNTNLQQLRFFLSANSDAPEVNLFGQPRISMWPIYTPTLANNVPPASPSIYLTPFDQMIANAATLTPSLTSTFTYYFGRQNAASPTVDWGSSSMSLLSSGSNTRNQNIFIFLRTLAKNAIPGYGYSFNSKYSSGEMDQILTEVFDYCRSLDPSDLATTGNNGTYAQTGASGGTWGVGQVTPICIPQANFGNLYSTKGFGRFDTVSDIALDFTQPGVSDTHNSSDTYITGLIYLGLFSPSMGYPALDPHMRVVVQSPGSTNTTPGVINMSITTSDGVSHPVFATLTGTKVFSCIPEQSLPDGGDNGWNNAHDGALLWGGAVGGRQMVINHYAYQTMASPPATQSTTPYMLCGLNIEIPKTCTTFSMAATPLEIKIYHANTGPFTATGDGTAGATADLVQDITVQFPAFSNLPLPTNATVGLNTVNTTLGNRLWYSGYGPENNATFFIDKGDVVQSLVGGYNGDLRLMAAQQTINDTVNTGTLGSAPSPAFVAHPLYGLANQPSNGLAMAHAFWDLFPSSGARYLMPGFSGASTPSSGTTGQLVTSATYPSSYSSGGYLCANFPATGLIVNPTTASTPNFDPNLTGDWDNGWGHFSDGPYINKADEAGYQYYTSGTYFGGGDLYYDGGVGNTYLGFSSPNRTVASPVMFGSLPTGVPLGKWSGSTYTAYATVQGPLGQAVPWQTLLFRPQAGHYGGSNGGTTIEDEELLDWFWMPQVEPYAISTTLATAGKVNMNYQIAPFTYITRATALMGVLGSEYVIAAPTTAGTTYKSDGQATYSTYRTPVKVLESDNYTFGDATGTFVPFKQRFSNGQIFKSAAEICDIYLVPQGQSWTNWDPVGNPANPSTSDAEKFWANNKLAGDNTRERPYNGLCSRLTTKSNTYTVHMRAQALVSPVNGTAGQWVENPQLITSEYRGSATINRYLDPKDPNIPDFTATNNLMKYSIDSYYKYRVLEKRRFLP